MQFHEENSNIQSVQYIPTPDFGTSHHGNGTDGRIHACKRSSMAGTLPHHAPLPNDCAASTTDAPKTESVLGPYLHNSASTGTALGFPPRDDLDLMLKHEDFPNILILSAKIKQYREILFHAPKGQRIVLSGPVNKLMDKDDAQVLAAVSRMQNQLLSPLCRQEMDGVVIRRGDYPLTDGTIDDALKNLEQEFDHVCKFVQRALNRQNNPATTGRGKKDSAAIAVKYSKWQTDLLMGWMIENVHHPFPSHDDIRDLMQSTGLSQSQVVNWTTNVRKRNRKATCENGKKPHHFIDFMFLAHYDNEEDRKKQERAESVQEQHGHLHSPSSSSSDLTMTTSNKKAPSSSTRSNKKKGNKKTDSRNAPRPPQQVSSVPMIPSAPDTLISRQHATASLANEHPHDVHQSDHSYYRLQQQYSHYQHQHYPLGDHPYEYHQEYEQFQHQNHLPIHHQHSQHHQYHHHHDDGMYTSSVLESHHPNDDVYDPPLQVNKSDHDDDRDDAHSLALGGDYHEGVVAPENSIDPDLYFAAHDDDNNDDHCDDDEHDAHEHEIQRQQQVERWGAIADSNTAELFSAMPFWGNEIGDDAMVLGGLAWLGTRRGGGGGDRDASNRHHDGNDVDHEDDQQDNDNDDVTAVATDDEENPIAQQQEHLYLCDWIPSILPTVTQDSSDFWLSMHTHGLNNHHLGPPPPLPLPSSAGAESGSRNSSSSSSSSATRSAGGGPKRGRINTMDVTMTTNECLDNDNQQGETVQQWASIGI